MTEHRLDPLLQPASIALLGASERDGSPGQYWRRWSSNPAYRGCLPGQPGLLEILGQPCYPDLASLPHRVEHVVIALGNAHLESRAARRIEHGARAATIYSSGGTRADQQPPLKQRLADMARAAGMQICGINGMGFYNLEQQLYAAYFRARRKSVAAASVTSRNPDPPLPRCATTAAGSASTCAYPPATKSHNGRRLHGLGPRATTPASSACSSKPCAIRRLSSPRLKKRACATFPVVVLKIGKSPLGASMAVTHTGAIAGNHAVFQALCRRYGVIEVDDFDEMAAILMLLQGGHAAASVGSQRRSNPAAFASWLPIPRIELGSNSHRSKSAPCDIGQHLDPGLKAENPLDIWGSHDRFEDASRPACGRWCRTRTSRRRVFQQFPRRLLPVRSHLPRGRNGRRETGKPLVLATCYSDLANSAICRRALRRRRSRPRWRSTPPCSRSDTCLHYHASSGRSLPQRANCPRSTKH